MKRLIGSLLVLSIVAISGSAMAGGKPDGARCHVHKSCQSKLCLREHPLDKFGECCDAQDCPSLGAQCGEIDNGCGTPVQCGECGPGSICSNNQCVQGTTTTTNTIPFNDSCAGFCGSNPPGGVCFCDTLSCDFGDGCADRDAECPTICNPPSTTTTTPPTTTTTLDDCAIECGGGLQICNESLTCYVFETDDACGVCGANGLCGDLTPCTTAAECSPGQICAHDTCCPTEGGVCVDTCTPDASTTTTVPPTTTTTVAPTTTTVAPTTTTLPPPTTTSTTLP